MNYLDMSREVDAELRRQDREDERQRKYYAEHPDEHPYTVAKRAQQKHRQRVINNGGRCFCGRGYYCGCAAYRSAKERLRIHQEASDD